MRTATALTLAAVGAILAFAITAQPPFFSFHIAGWVLMITGLVGAVVPRRGYGWLRRRLVLTTPGNRRREIDVRRRRFSRLLVPGGIITEEPFPAEVGVQSGTVAGGTVAGGTVAGGTMDGGTVGGSTVDGSTVDGSTVESDIIEQYIEDYDE
jgi:hypothetical protein